MTETSPGKFKGKFKVTGQGKKRHVNPETIVEAEQIVTVGSDVALADAERIGLNVLAQDTGASQILKNWIPNPGFEDAVWNSLIHVRGTASAGKIVMDFWETAWNVPGEIGFDEGLFDGGTYRVMTGVNKGATGTITSFVHEDGRQVFYISDLALELANWTCVHVSATQAMPDAGEPRPGSAGLRSTEVQISDPVWKASKIWYFDSFRRDFDASAPLFIKLEGPMECRFWAKGPATIRVRLERQGLTPVFDTTIVIGADWEEQVITVNPAVGSDYGEFDNNAVVILSVYTDAPFLIDDLFLGKTSYTNPTVFVDEFVDRLKELNPGVLRDWSNQLGSTFAGQTASPYARGYQGWKHSIGYAHAYSFGLREFLDLCLEVGCDPWYVIPPTWTDAEMAALDTLLTVDYAGDFVKIHLEYGNEMWGAAAGDDPFKGASALGGANLGVMADSAFTNLSADARYNLIIGGQFYFPGRQEEIDNNAALYDQLALAPYFGIIGEEASDEQLFQSLFARAVDDVVNGKVAQSFAYVTSLAVYEINFHTFFPDDERKKNFVRGRGGALAMAFFCLQYQKFLGMRHLCPFGSLQFSAKYGTVLSPIWGMLRDVGRKRPTWLGVELVNAAIQGDMVATSHSDDSGVAVPAINEVSEATVLKHIHSFAFKNGATYTVVLFNFSENAILTDVVVTGEDHPVWTCRGIWGDYWEHNDAVAEAVTIETLAPLNSAGIFQLPGHGVFVLTNGE